MEEKKEVSFDIDLNSTPGFMLRYKCGNKDCGSKVRGCKLWMKRGPDGSVIHLLCAECASKDQNIDISGIHEKLGTFKNKERMITTSIGKYVPAVPCEGSLDSGRYPNIKDISWWYSLPLFPDRREP